MVSAAVIPKAVAVLLQMLVCLLAVLLAVDAKKCKKRGHPLARGPRYGPSSAHPLASVNPRYNAGSVLPPTTAGAGLVGVSQPVISTLQGSQQQPASYSIPPQTFAPLHSLGQPASNQQGPENQQVLDQPAFNQQVLDQHPLQPIQQTQLQPVQAIQPQQVIVATPQQIEPPIVVQRQKEPVIVVQREMQPEPQLVPIQVQDEIITIPAQNPQVYPESSPQPAGYQLQNSIALLKRINPTFPMPHSYNWDNDCLILHNTYRSAVGMRPLTYSGALQTAAQKWADNLAARDAFEHSQGNTGENLYMLSTTGTNLDTSCTTPVRKWFEEFPLYKGEPIASNFQQFELYGHFTQLIWPSTTSVGCASRRYRVGAADKQVTVCEYSPPGNLKGVEMTYTVRT